jgi:hypothetical protein
VLFLHSDLEYEWPVGGTCSGGCRDTLLAYLCGLCILAGMMLWLIFPAVAQRHLAVGLLLAPLGLLCLAAAFSRPCSAIPTKIVRPPPPAAPP